MCRIQGGGEGVKLSIEYKQPRVEVGFTAPSLGVSTGTPVAREYVDRPAYDGPYSVTPTESAQTLSTNGKRMTGDVAVGAIPSDYVGSAVPRKTSEDLTESGPTVAVPAGYYSEAASKPVQSGSVSVPYTEKQVTPTVTVSPVTGTIYATVEDTFDVEPTVNEGYVTSGAPGTVRLLGVGVKDLSAQRAKTVTPTESEQTAVAAHKYTVGDVKVAAIPSDYIGSEVPQKTSSDLTVSGATVTAPAGYYAEAASKSVAVGSVSVEDATATANPTITVSTVGLISASYQKTVTVTPSVTEGYVTGGESGSVTVSGSKTYQLSIQSAKTVTPTESEQTAVELGKYTAGEVKVGAIPSNYVGSSVPTQAAQTITPTTADQTIASGKYLTGAQTILGDANLVPESIVENITIFGVTGNAPPPVTVVHLL